MRETTKTVGFSLELDGFLRYIKNFEVFFKYAHLNIFRSFYQPEGAYCISKACQIMFTLSLNKKLSLTDDCHVKVYALHPGIVKTDLYANARYMTVSHLFCRFFKSRRDIFSILNWRFS